MMDRQLEPVLKKILEKLRSSYRPQKVILFGSWAWGHPREDSDIDLLVVKDTDERFLDRCARVKRMLKDVHRSFSLDAPVMTPAEIADRLARGDQFIKTIMEKGMVLFDAASGQERFDEVLEKLRQSVTARLGDVRAFSEIEPAIQKILDKLVPDYAPQKVILFGTWAAGKAYEDSDIDLLIVKETSQRFIDRWKTVRKILTDPKRKRGLDTVILSPQEIQRRLAKGDPFVKEILETGMVLYAA